MKKTTLVGVFVHVFKMRKQFLGDFSLMYLFLIARCADECTTEQQQLLYFLMISFYYLTPILPPEGISLFVL